MPNIYFDIWQKMRLKPRCQSLRNWKFRWPPYQTTRHFTGTEDVWMVCSKIVDENYSLMHFDMGTFYML